MSGISCESGTQSGGRILTTFVLESPNLGATYSCGFCT